MKITVRRRYKKATYTIGNLLIGGKWICNTLEDTDRGLKQTDTLASIKSRKVYGETAIPSGTYKVRMDVISPKYKSVSWYDKLCGGKMPRLENIPGYDGILIHPGTTALDTLGCILVGENKAKGKLLNSRATFQKLYAMMKAAADKGEAITIEVS